MSHLMKALYTSVLAVLVTVTIVGILSISTQQVYAPRDCPSCSEFKKLTDQFEKDVIDFASVNPPEPERIQTLLGDYDKNVRMIFGLEPTTEADPPGETEPSEDDDEPRTPGTP